MTFEECCEAILLDRANPALNYAVGYATAGRTMTGHAAKVQALYILNNSSRWRGDVAREVRASLKEIGGLK